MNNNERDNYDKSNDYDDDDYDYYGKKKPKISQKTNYEYDLYNYNNNNNPNEVIESQMKELELKKKKEDAKNKLGKKVSNLEEVLNLPGEKFYEYLNLRNTIKNWNDFSQAKFPNKSFNDIKMLDVDQQHKSSYIKGNEFLLALLN